jgi:alkylation response protein AidB-like acyl-CoA dehydrogenase
MVANLRGGTVALRSSGEHSLDFSWSESQRLFYAGIERFAQAELAPGARARAMASGFPWDVSARFAEMGLLGITVREEDGGAGGNLVDAILAILAIAAACPRSADVIQAGNFGAIRTFAEHASPEQKARFLPDLLAGRTIMALGMTEPEAGSAVTDLTTSARPDGDGYIVNGTKVFGTHSSEATLFLVYVRFGASVGGIGSVLIEKGTPGFTLGQPSTFMNGETWSQLYFEDCRIPAANVLLGPGGFQRQIAGFNIERLGNAARSLAVGRHAFDVAREHAATRRQFGRHLCEFQGIQWKFAEAAARLEAAQLMLMKAAVCAADGLPSAQDTALAKLLCNEAGYQAADQAMQIMGATGFSEESIVQYCVRRTRGWMIAGGSTEILKNRIAEGLFERRFSQRSNSTVAIE